MTSIEITLPGLPPTINHVYIFKGFRKIIKPIGISYQQKVGILCKQALALKNIRVNPYGREKTLHVELHFFSSNWITKKKPSQPSRLAGDLDNRVKFLLDCLQKSLDFDDCQVFSLACSKKKADSEYTKISITDFPLDFSVAEQRN
jgi:Holliday junction resolvase RusA-like endonuclease